MGTYHCSNMIPHASGKMIFCNCPVDSKKAKILKYKCPECDGQLIMYGKEWILEHSPQFLSSIEPRTVRSLHYKLVKLGFPNNIPCYKRIVSVLTEARWEGLVTFESFVDHERNTIGTADYEETDVDAEIQSTKESIEYWLKAYRKNRWENQPYYIEAWVEKKAQEGNFQHAIMSRGVKAFACKGYPSLTWLKKAASRFQDALDTGKEIVIVYFGDYDPSGEDIPRNLKDSLQILGIDVTVDRILLLEQQVIDWDLPPAPTKITDSRTSSWDGIGQVEMDAIDDKEMVQHIKESIDKYFDQGIHDALKKQEIIERKKYQIELKNFVLELAEKLEGSD